MHACTLSRRLESEVAKFVQDSQHSANVLHNNLNSLTQIVQDIDDDLSSLVAMSMRFSSLPEYVLDTQVLSIKQLLEERNLITNIGVLDATLRLRAESTVSLEQRAQSVESILSELQQDVNATIAQVLDYLAKTDSLLYNLQSSEKEQSVQRSQPRVARQDKPLADGWEACLSDPQLMTTSVDKFRAKMQRFVNSKLPFYGKRDLSWVTARVRMAYYLFRFLNPTFLSFLNRLFMFFPHIASPPFVFSLFFICMLSCTLHELHMQFLG